MHRPSSNLTNLKNLPVETFQANILDPEAMLQACQGVQWVYHTASQSAYWRYPESVKQTAVDGTRNVAEAALASGVERFVFTSSMSSLGIPAEGECLTEQHTFNLPESKFPYGAAKHQAEIALLEIVDRGLDAVILNPSLILGPGDLNIITGSFVIEAARGLGFFYLDGGTNYVHIEDVVQGHLAAAKLGECGRRYILGGENVAHYEAFTIFTQVVGRRPPWLKIPGWFVPPVAWLIELLQNFVKLPFDANQLRLSRYYTYCDVAPARQELKLGPPTPLRQAAEDTYHWYREEGMLD
jgi:dihydroflavonol-4-reductase